MDWIPISDRLPDANEEVLLRSKREQYFIGTYFSNASVFRVISRYRLEEDGRLAALTTGFHPSNFTHWAKITLPETVTGVTAEQLAIAISEYLHTCDGLQPLVWHQARGISIGIADAVLSQLSRQTNGD